MQQEMLKYFDEAIFRTNSVYELVIFESLPLEQQQLLKALQKAEDCYAILRPCQRPELGIKSVDQETASLLPTLQEPGCIPAYVKSLLGAEYHKTILALVLDRILEIEWQGTFVSGLEACDVLYAEQPLSIPQGLLAQLSFNAVKYAQALDLYDAAKLSLHLYYYNRIPCSSHWQRKFPTTDAIAEHLGLQAHSSTTSLLKRYWAEVIPASSFGGWFIWSACHVQPEVSTSRFIYKLYISPTPEFTRDAFQTVIKVLGNEQATHLKIGKDLLGLLRPDKFIVYFSSIEACQNTAALLKQKLAGLPAQGVPFTAEIAGDGLLSWGIDPPAEQQVFKGKEGESWRSWVTNRLAAALLTAKVGLSDRIEPWQCALKRLQLDGVDTESWTPPQLCWQTYL